MSTTVLERLLRGRTWSPDEIVVKQAKTSAVIPGYLGTVKLYVHSYA